MIVGQIFEDATKAVRAVSLIEDVAKRFELAQQAQRRTTHFKHNGFLDFQALR